MNPLLITGLFEIGKGLIDRLFPDPAAKAAAQLELIKLQQSGELAQLAAATDLAKLQVQTNIEEAKHPSLLVSGGRPFIMWVCGISMAYAAILEPMARFIADVIFGYTGAFPEIDTDITLQVLMGLLGLSGLRTWEKGKGVARS